MRAGCLKFKSEIACVARMAGLTCGGGLLIEEAYLGVAEKRLSNELACTIGCEPTTVSFAAAAGASELPESDGFNGGRAAACLVVSAFGAVAVFDADASGC